MDWDREEQPWNTRPSGVDAIRDILSWLGKCSREQVEHSMHLVFKFTPEADAQSTLKLKVEINTREPESLFGTKLRALRQRRKNRDLFDLHHGLDQLAMDLSKLIACFDHYLVLEGKTITRALAEHRMLEKLTRSLIEDIAPLLPASVRFNYDDAMRAFEHVWTELMARINGDAWKMTDKMLEELRATRYPDLLRR